MMSDYYAVIFHTEGFDQEIWLAMLAEWPFESFHEESGILTGYIHISQWSEDLKLFLKNEKDRWYNNYTIDQVPDVNWNAVWESSFAPVAIDDYCFIYADFHERPIKKYTHEILIAPKMAFGTGHHATTFMMIRAMSGLDFKGKEVFDFGCGTGILSVLAALEGAAHVFGNDIQVEAIENSLEHAQLNGVSEKCHFALGGLELAADKTFDIILANINTKIIIHSFESLKKMLRPGGWLLLSGIMERDMNILMQEIQPGNLEQTEINQQEDWMQITMHSIT